MEQIDSKFTSLIRLCVARSNYLPRPRSSQILPSEPPGLTRSLGVGTTLANPAPGATGHILPHTPILLPILISRNEFCSIQTQMVADRQTTSPRVKPGMSSAPALVVKGAARPSNDETKRLSCATSQLILLDALKKDFGLKSDCKMRLNPRRESDRGSRNSRTKGEARS